MEIEVPDDKKAHIIVRWFFDPIFKASEKTPIQYIDGLPYTHCVTGFEEKPKNKAGYLVYKAKCRIYHEVLINMGLHGNPSKIIKVLYKHGQNG